MEPGANTLVVCGATGKQGGAVIDALLADGRWDVVALSRSVDRRETRELLPDALTLEQYLRTTTRDTTRW